MVVTMVKLTHIALFLCLISNASAYYIMDVASSTDNVITGATSIVNVTLTARGDETAYDTVLEMRLPDGITANKVMFGQTQPNKSYESQFTITVNESVMPGTYVTPIYLYYADTNGYPLSMVYPLKINVKKYNMPKVGILLKNLELNVDEKKQMKVTIKNDDDIEHEINLYEFFPVVLLVTDMPNSVTIPPKSVKSVDVSVTTFGALPDSSFTVLMSASYVQDGIRYDSVGATKVMIPKQTAESSTTKNPLIYLALAAVLLIAAFLGWKYWKSKKSKPKKKTKSGKDDVSQ